MNVTTKKTARTLKALAPIVLVGALLGSGAGATTATELTRASASGPLQFETPVAQNESGLWYADRLRFDELQAAGHTGAGMKIAVIDVALNPDIAELQGANISVMGSFCAFRDTGEVVPATSDDPTRAGHGTDVVSLLVGNGVAADGGPGIRGIVPEAEVMFYAVGMPEEVRTQATPNGCEPWNARKNTFFADDPNFSGGAGEAAAAAYQALEDGADVVAVSRVDGDGMGWTYTVRELLRAGVPLIAGTLNPTGSLDELLNSSYPFSLNGVVAVSAVDSEGNLLHGGGDDALSREAIGADNLGFVSAGSSILGTHSEGVWQPSLASGTSYATPLVAGTLALGMQAHPDATANQVLQAMVRTTGNQGWHEPEWNGKQWGYGIANPTALIASDPASMPDENPLFVMTHTDERCVSENYPNPQSMEECQWSLGPTAETVWHEGEEPEEPSTAAPQAPGNPEDSEANNLPTIVWVIGGLAVLGVVFAAIMVPVVLSRSRRKQQHSTNMQSMNLQPTNGDQR